ncbi:hypothetical protein [Pseudofulvibacter geojedonensis]|uniref:Lipoprotein n=1 Tax=Pseudofulvibacter geojedonensis TaxID=1123758 RepID=A0ABW3I0C4_9FLAO
MKKEIIRASFITLFLAFIVYHFIKVESFKLDVSFKRWDIMYLESDIGTIGEITSKRMFKRSEIDTFLINNYYPSDGDYDINGDTIFLNRSYLVFNKDSLIKFEPNSYKEN